VCFRAKYQDPTVDEGFSEVVTVNFVPQFASEQEETLYKMHLLEK
jgi:bifunctional polynucleotide phosphatase/kinase